MRIPSAIEPLLHIFSPVFTRPTYHRWTTFVLAAILTVGRKTVLNVLRVAPALTPGHSSSYHRIFSKRRWSSWRLARALCFYILKQWVPDGRIYLLVDDTVDEHRGARVYGKGCHRDPVRSTHTHVQFRWGHKWVVLAILVKFPFATRPWALPVLVALYRPRAEEQPSDVRHKTPATLARQLLVVLRRWFPERAFVLSGDGAFNSHKLAHAVARHGSKAVLVSRFFPDGNVYAPPPARRKGRAGRPRIKGKKLPAPKQVVAQSKRRRLTVSWYGGGQRQVEVVTGTGGWYRGGEGVVAIRWVYVHDLTGTHRDEYFFSTDVGMTPKQIVEAYTGRWAIEVTFEEMRAYIGLETTRGWSPWTVRRMAPGLFGLYAMVALMYAKLPKRMQEAGRVTWSGKESVTFSDAITALRRYLWLHWVFESGGHRMAFSKLPRNLKATLLYAMAPAA